MVAGVNYDAAETADHMAEKMEVRALWSVAAARRYHLRDVEIKAAFIKEK